MNIIINVFLLALEVSISPVGYEVDESAGVVQVDVQKSGVFPSPITGTLTATAGTAGRTDFLPSGVDYPSIPMANIS